MLRGVHAQAYLQFLNKNPRSYSEDAVQGVLRILMRKGKRVTQEVLCYMPAPGSHIERLWKDEPYTERDE